MLFVLTLSVLLQSLEIAGVSRPYSPLVMIRAPRPLIMIRFIRVFLKFSMPKARINQIFKRSSHQIYNVTIFFLFFMSLYGLLGVQFFGELNYHCVRDNTPKHLVSLLLNRLWMVYSLVVRARGLEYGGREFESRSLHLKP